MIVPLQWQYVKRTIGRLRELVPLRSLLPVLLGRLHVFAALCRHSTCGVSFKLYYDRATAENFAYCFIPGYSKNDRDIGYLDRWDRQLAKGDSGHEYGT